MQGEGRGDAILLSFLPSPQLQVFFPCNQAPYVSESQSDRYSRPKAPERSCYLPSKQKKINKNPSGVFDSLPFTSLPRTVTGLSAPVSGGWEEKLKQKNKKTPPPCGFWTMSANSYRASLTFAANPSQRLRHHPHRHCLIPLLLLYT